jgi:uncharacterized protein (DUF1778 family)
LGLDAESMLWLVVAFGASKQRAFGGVFAISRQVVALGLRVDNSYTFDQNPCSFCVDTQTVKGTPVRDAAINLRAKPEQRDLIDQAAAMLGKNRSDFMLEAACDRAQSVLLDQVYFQLDASRFRNFIRQLDAPPAPDEGLERLMAVKAPWGAPGAKRAHR